MKYKGLIISDIHVGAFDVERLYKEYTDIFLNYIKKLKTLDFLIITGDYFDHKFYLNDKESIYAYKMMQELIDVCKPLNTKIRIVYGTESHECNQYDILNILNLYDDIKVIKNVSEEELFKDLHILYLPEEYIVDKDEYYKDYFSNINKYDLILGHGVIREVMKDAVAHMTSSENKRKKVPIFTSKELEKICKGYCFFGHYHINYNIDDKIFSVGSFSRWQFGEDGVKGFYEVELDPDKAKYKYKYIENTLAESYKTISFGYNSNIYSNQDKMQKELSRIDELIDNDVFDHVRFEFNIPSDLENPEGVINFIKEKYKFNDNIKVNMVHGYIAEKKEKQKKEIEKENEKYAFIFDKNIEIPDQVSRFISIEYNKELPVELVNVYMTNSVEEILEEVKL